MDAGASQASDWQHPTTPILPTLQATGSHCKVGGGSQVRRRWHALLNFSVCYPKFSPGKHDVFGSTTACKATF